MRKFIVLICVIGSLIVSLSIMRLRERIFPPKYRFIVELTANKYYFDPLWIASIIYVESSFNPQAVSPSGACGLMQLMPQTAEEIIRKTKYKEYKEKDLFLPSLNIELGCWYLSDLFAVFNNQRLALVAYNAGRGNLQKWLEKNPEADVLDYIEFPETKEYIVRIDRVYRILRFLNTIWPFYTKNRK